MMLLSSGCKYGLRAILYLAKRADRGPTLVRSIAEDLNIPFAYLSKVVRILVRGRILNSRKGRGGGVGLARPPEQIALLDVVEAIDGSRYLEGCALGLPECSEKRPCPLHESWGAIRAGIRDMLRTQTVASFAEGLVQGRGTEIGEVDPNSDA